VTSSGTCPNDSPWALSYRLSIRTIPLSGFVSEIFSPKVATKIITWWRHQWRHTAWINSYYPWGPYRHTIQGTLPFAREEAFYIKKIMTSLGHVTSSGAWPIDSPRSLSYYTHWTVIIFVKLTINILLEVFLKCYALYKSTFFLTYLLTVSIGVGDGWAYSSSGGKWPSPTNKNPENIFRAIIM